MLEQQSQSQHEWNQSSLIYITTNINTSHNDMVDGLGHSGRRPSITRDHLCLLIRCLIAESHWALLVHDCLERKTSLEMDWLHPLLHSCHNWNMGFIHRLNNFLHLSQEKNNWLLTDMYRNPVWPFCNNPNAKANLDIYQGFAEWWGQPIRPEAIPTAYSAFWSATNWQNFAKCYSQPRHLPEIHWILQPTVTI